MVSVKNVIKRYNDYQLELSMEIPDGAVIGLIGKNGAGKSTTIKTILGLVQPDEGEVLVFDKEAHRLTSQDKEKLGVSLSDSGFSQYFQIEDIMKILEHMYSDFSAERFKEICRSHGLPMKKQIKDFSTGMKAKLRVLVALSHEAELLIMDEPTAGLDVEARRQILDMIREYLAENSKRSVLITSHISSDLEGLCDSLYLIHDGKVILQEDTDVILDRYAVLKVDETLYQKLDQTYLIKAKKENFGYSCITDQKQYYLENYPGIIAENGNIDDLILILTGGN